MYDGAPSKKEGSQTQSDAGIINSGTEKCVRPVFVFFFFCCCCVFIPTCKIWWCAYCGRSAKKTKTFSYKLLNVGFTLAAVVMLALLFYNKVS